MTKNMINNYFAPVCLYNLFRRLNTSHLNQSKCTFHGQIKSSFIYIEVLIKVYLESVTLADDLFILTLGGKLWRNENSIKNCDLCQVQAHLVENEIEIRDYTAVSSDVTLLATDDLDTVSTVKRVNGGHQAEENSNNLIWADPGSCCYALYAKLNPDTVLLQQSPLALAKALKVVCFYHLNKDLWLLGQLRSLVWTFFQPTLHKKLKKCELDSYVWMNLSRIANRLYHLSLLL